MSTSDNKKTYYAKAIKDEDGQLVVVFQEEFLKELDLQPNEIIKCQIAEGKQVFQFIRTNFIDS